MSMVNAIEFVVWIGLACVAHQANGAMTAELNDAR